MGLPLVPCSIGTENGIVYEGYQHPKEGMPSTADGLQYKYSWDWLMPVIHRLKVQATEIDRDWIDEEAQHIIDDIDNALTCCWGICVAHRYTVEAIMNYNEHKS